MSADSGEILLGNEARFTVGRVLVGGIIGAASVLFLGNLANILDLQWDLRRLGSNAARPEEFTAVFVLGAVIGAGIWSLIWIARQPLGARVTWDKTALCDHDGHSIRTCIPWAGAMHQKVEVWEKRKGGRKHGGFVLQVSDAAGRIVTVNGSSLALPWMMTRKLSAQNPMIDLFNRVLTLPAGKKFGPDRDSLRRPSFRLWSFLSFASMIAIAFSLLQLQRDREAAPVIAAAALVLLLTTALVPGRELWRLRAPPGSIEAPLDGRLDLSGLVHGDALIDTRRGGNAWVVKGPDGKVTALETADARAARISLMTAVWLEVVLKLAIVGALVTLLVLKDLAQRRTRGY